MFLSCMSLSMLNVLCCVVTRTEYVGAGVERGLVGDGRQGPRLTQCQRPHLEAQLAHTVGAARAHAHRAAEPRVRARILLRTAWIK